MGGVEVTSGGVGRVDLRSKDRARVGPDGMDDRSASSRSARGVDAGSDASCGVCWSRLSVCSMRLIPVFIKVLPKIRVVQ